ncbi:MAG: hypothetical protein HC842_06185 [Cytophagales bacterium]|nr:hypothetical protein [Cytophagales bacterium]
MFEEGGDFSINTVSIPYYPYSSFIGIQLPEGDKMGMLQTDKDHNVKLVCLNAQGQVQNRSGVRVELYKLDWRWWWDNSYEDLGNYVGRSYHTPISSGEVDLLNGQGNYRLRINQPEWGRYYLVATDPVSGHSAGQVVFIDWPGWAGKGREGRGGATLLDFSTDKEEYQVGEKIQLTVPSAPGGRLLVSMETGSRVIQASWEETEEGKTLLELEASPEMSPNVYIHLTLIQPHAQTTNDLPIRLYGVASIKVVDPATRLEPVVVLPKELSPEQNFSIQVSEKRAKPWPIPWPWWTKGCWT